MNLNESFSVNKHLLLTLKKPLDSAVFLFLSPIRRDVHFITFSDEECEVKDIQKTIGDAIGFIYRVDRLSIFDMFFPSSRIDEIYKISDIPPSDFRSDG